MPLPKPSAEQSEKEWMAECMGDPTMNEEFPDQEQRAAVCHRQYREKSMTMTTTHQQLVEAIRARKAAGHVSRFGYGIGTADLMVKAALEEIGDGFCKRVDGGLGATFDRDGAIKEAMNRLVCCQPEAKIEQTATVGNFKAMLPDGIEAPPHTLMVMRYTLTTGRKDRDGDVLHPDGAEIDPAGPMLWQHLFNLPIGKMLTVVEKSAKRLREVGVLLDLNELTEDCAKLFEAGALRFSHGFQAIDWRELKSTPPDMKGRSPGKIGFEVLRYEILERSAVSVPSNADAILELHSRGKLASEVMQRRAKSMLDKRPASVPGVTIKQAGPDGKNILSGPVPMQAEYVPVPEAILATKQLNPAEQTCLAALMETAAKCRECAEACRPLADRMWAVIQSCQTLAGAADAAARMLAAGSTAGLAACKIVLEETALVLAVHKIDCCEACLQTCLRCTDAVAAVGGAVEGATMTTAVDTKGKPKMIECPECGGRAVQTGPGKADCPECGEVETAEEKAKEPPADKAEDDEEEEAGSKCSECDATVPADATECPECGAKIAEEPASEKTWSDAAREAAAAARRANAASAAGGAAGGKEADARSSGASALSHAAESASKKAEEKPSSASHGRAAAAHERASREHAQAAKEQSSAHNTEKADEHRKAEASHLEAADAHRREERRHSAKSTTPTAEEVKSNRWSEPDAVLVCDCGYRAPKKFFSPKKHSDGKLMCPKCKKDMREDAGEAAEIPEEEVAGAKHLEGQHDQATHAHGGDGGASVDPELQSFAEKHGGRIENGVMMITPPKLLSAGAGSTEVGPSSLPVETIDGPATVRRAMGKFYLETDDGSQRLDSKDELAIVRVGGKKKSGIWVTVEQMRAVCPGCAAKMVEKNLSRVNVEELEPDVLRSFLSAKAGRVLSAANVGKLQECLDDLEELAGLQLPRAAGALAGRMISTLRDLIAAASPPSEEPGTEKQSDKTLAGWLAKANHAELLKLRATVQAMLDVEASDAKGAEYRRLVSC